MIIMVALRWRSGVALVIDDGKEWWWRSKAWALSPRMSSRFSGSAFGGVFNHNIPRSHDLVNHPQRPHPDKNGQG
jgi:hypothetical protein